MHLIQNMRQKQADLHESEVNLAYLHREFQGARQQQWQKEGVIFLY